MLVHTPVSESGLSLQNRFPLVATSVFHNVESIDEPLNSSSNVNDELAGAAAGPRPTLAGASVAPTTADLAGAAAATSNNSDSVATSVNGKSRRARKIATRTRLRRRF